MPARVEPRLKTYTDDIITPKRRWASRGLVAALIVFTLFQGLFFAFFAPYLMVMFAIVPAALLGVIIWALPDAQNPPTRLMEGVLFAYFVATYLWPNYLAVALPGLPWITFIRLTDFPLVFLLAVCFSQSESFRRDLTTIVAAVPIIWRLLLGVAIIMVITLPLSKVLSDSISKFILVVMNWFAVYFASAYYFRRHGRVERFVLALCTIMFVLGLMAIAEAHVRHILWAYNIPSFLKIEDPSVIGLLKGAGRAYTNIYRTQTTFTGPLGFGEFVAMVFPFVFYFVVSEYKQWVRIVACAGVLFLFLVAFLSGSRSAILGGLISGMITLGVWGFVRWRRRGSSLLGAAVVFSYPVVGALVLAATFLVGRIRNKVWGGGETVSSTQARVDQWHQGIPLILKNPIGHGVGSAADVLQYRLPSGLLVIDSYFLRILLDWGVLGFILFFGMVFAAIGYAGRVALEDRFEDQEIGFVVPIAISLFTWFTVKAVNAEEGNHPLVFIMLGIITALYFRSRQEANGTATRAKPSPLLADAAAR